MQIRPMLPHEEPHVREIFSLCHPEAPPMSRFWYFAHPTLVAVSDDGNTVEGFTSFTTTLLSGHSSIMYGQDICVAPQMQGRGVATALHAARLSAARTLGCTAFIGATTVEAMHRVLVKAGAHACVPVGDTTVYVAPLQERSNV